MTNKEARSLLDMIIETRTQHEPNPSLDKVIKTTEPNQVPELSTESHDNVGDTEIRSINGNGQSIVSFRMRAPERYKFPSFDEILAQPDLETKVKIANAIVASQMPYVIEIGDNLEMIAKIVEHYRALYSFWNSLALEKGIIKTQEIIEERKETYKKEKKAKAEKEAKETAARLPKAEKSAVLSGFKSKQDLIDQFKASFFKKA